ncbi:hypothetical protein ACJRO7_020184 [Eucalyptus globulus]|uniref:Uncharacterized protein n=1 Tax=Eucalyptus globulus TaxID=34317 RepID=A0ABD3KFQ7_EUCGL
MKGLARPSCFLLLVLLCISVAASILLFDIGGACHDVFVSTFMLVVRSNRAIVYVVFNFIIVVIFLGSLRSSKPITSGDIDGIFFAPPLLENIDHEITLIEEENSGNSDRAEDDEYHGYDGFIMLIEEENSGNHDDDEDDEYHGYDGYEEDNDDDMEEEEEDEDSEAEEGDSDLEKRSEEFIAKMNSRWREELLHERLLCMVYASAPKLELL